MAGESELEMAEKDGISLEAVRCSIQEGQKREFDRLLSQFLGLQLEAAIDKEEIRKSIRNRLADKFGKALGTLLSGERNLPCRDRKTGKIRIRKFVDPKVLAVGLEQFRKTVSLVEQPAPMAVILTDVPQNGPRSRKQRAPVRQ